MKTKHILTALATASLIVGGQALAQGRGGGHGGGNAGGQGMGRGGGGVDVGTRGGIGTGLDRARVNTDITTGTRVGRDFGISTRTDARANSQGPANANPRARARASENSVLATDRVVPDLSALETGLLVRDSTGADIGTVVRINRSNDGTIRNVLVRGGNGRTFPLAPNSLTISGDIVTATDFTLDD
jgi:hypothetical protein